MQKLKGEVALLDPAFDELEGLMTESLRINTAPRGEVLEDLDALLKESTALAGAKRAQKQGRKLTAEQVNILESNHLAEQMQVWEPVETVAHFIHTTCACGQESRRFNAWYKLLEHRQQDSTRLVRCDGHEGLPASQYITSDVAEYCHECLAPVALPFADTEDLPMLSSLGEKYEQNGEQLGTDLLAELCEGTASEAVEGGEHEIL